MSEHTPGPWHIVEDKPLKPTNFRKDWRIIAGPERGQGVVTESSYQSTRWGETEHESGVRIKLEDAQLIAAAPDLLAALHAVALRNDDDGPCFCTMRIPAGEAHHLSCQRANAAIAKARGR